MPKADIMPPEEVLTKLQAESRSLTQRSQVFFGSWRNANLRGAGNHLNQTFLSGGREFRNSLIVSFINRHFSPISGQWCRLFGR